MSFVPTPSPDDPTPRCPHCGKRKRAVMSFEEHVEVIEGPGGAISTRTEQRLERRCAWCGTLLEPPRPVVIQDLDPL